jgi:hypothetical protein
MPNGFAPALLQHITAVGGTNPSKRLAVLGMLAAVLSVQNGGAKISQHFEAGHQRDLLIKYRKRVLTTAVANTPGGCAVGNTPAYDELTMPALDYREYSLFVPDSLIRQYEQDASRMVAVPGSQPTSAMAEVYDMLMDGASAVLRSMNTALVTTLSTNFGQNVTTGLNTARALSFSLGTTGMNDAMVQLLSDIRENELKDNVTIVGNGALSNYDLIRNIMNGNNTQGLSQSALSNLIPKVYYDKDTKSILGANQVAVIEEGAAQLITRNLYTGNFAGKHGTSTFMTMALPVSEFGGKVENLQNLLFDVQIKEIDCPGTMTINGVANTAVTKGVLITISKYFKLFTMPTNMYAAGDPLANTNGILRYTMTATA